MNGHDARWLQMRRVKNLKMARGMAIIGAISSGLLMGGAGLIVYDQAKNLPELVNENELEQAANQLASYSGSNPEAALLEAKELVQKNDAENGFYQEDYDKVYVSIDHLIGLGIRNITQPEFYGAQLDNVAGDIRDVAQNQAVKEGMYNSAEEMFWAGLFPVISFGGMAALSSYMIKKEQDRLDN
jgi:hypothetical protein